MEVSKVPSSWNLIHFSLNRARVLTLASRTHSRHLLLAASKSIARTPPATSSDPLALPLDLQRTALASLATLHLAVHQRPPIECFPVTPLPLALRLGTLTDFLQPKAFQPREEELRIDPLIGLLVIMMSLFFRKPMGIGNNGTLAYAALKHLTKYSTRLARPHPTKPELL